MEIIILKYIWGAVHFFKEMNNCIQPGCIRSDSKDVYNVRLLYFK